MGFWLTSARPPLEKVRQYRVGGKLHKIVRRFTDFRISGMKEASLRGRLIRIFRNQMALFPLTLSLRKTGRHVLRNFSAYGFYNN